VLDGVALRFADNGGKGESMLDEKSGEGFWVVGRGLVAFRFIEGLPDPGDRVGRLELL
jgi:hypothetical protein